MKDDPGACIGTYDRNRSYTLWGYYAGSPMSHPPTDQASRMPKQDREHHPARSGSVAYHHVDSGAMHTGHDHARHDVHEEHHSGHAHHHDEHDAHAGHGGHAGHEALFRRKFWVSLILSIPVVLFSEMIQDWFNFSLPEFAGSDWVAPVLGTVVFIYGGWVFLQGGWDELKQRQPGMMLLI